MFNFNIDGASFEIVEKSGELTENEVWDGRIYITSTVVVPEGITLTIRSGTIVGFEPTDTPSELIVHGELYAEGSPERMIVFGSLGKQRKIEQSPIAKTTTPAFATNPSTMEGHGDTAPGIPRNRSGGSTKSRRLGRNSD